jgi:hypothetical protein
MGVAVLGLLVFGAITLLSADRPSERQVAAVATTPVQPAPAPPPIDPNSGFDVTTDPARVKVILDGNHIGESPLRVRSLLAGKHRLEVVGPPGWKGATRELLVEQGKAEKIDIKLENTGAAATSRLAVVKITSEPSGARAMLLDGGVKTALGLTPTEAKLDATRRYQVAFELDGYEPETRDVTFAGDTGEVTASLGKSGGAPVVSALPATDAPRDVPKKPAVKKPEPPPRRMVAKAPPRPAPPKKTVTSQEPRITSAETTPISADPREPATPRAPKVTAPAETNPPADAQVGKLSIGAKPQCTILLDGKDTGRMTPAIGLEVKPGTVSVTLVNGEFGIKEKFNVTVKAGETTKFIKDFSDRIPQ